MGQRTAYLFPVWLSLLPLLLSSCFCVVMKGKDKDTPIKPIVFVLILAVGVIVAFLLGRTLGGGGVSKGLPGLYNLGGGHHHDHEGHIRVDLLQEKLMWEQKL